MILNANMRFFVCLCPFYAKTIQLILINFGMKIVLIMEKNIGYFFSQKNNFKGVK